MSGASDPALAAGIAVPDASAVLALLASHVPSALGRAEWERLRFHRDPAVLRELHQRLAEASLWRDRGFGFAFADLTDPREWLRQANVAGGVLNGQELLQTLAFLDAVAALRSAVLGHAGADLWPALCAIAVDLPPWLELRRQLRAALLPSGDLADDASPELARLRRRRAQQRLAIEAELAAQMRRLGAEGALQDEVITVRNDRFVLPVRADQRRRAPGLVHGASSTGQTLFLEPMETVELNNENIRLGDQEQAEVVRILTELTGAVRAAAAEIEAAAAGCGILEFEAAKARFAAEYGARPAVFGAQLILRSARHPLLVAVLRRQGREAVPLTLRLGALADNGRMLVVSGPNTGGKTVVLKTVAIAAWMAQCGLPVCADDAELPIFDAIWADVGDVQSIEQNLSTFSSHLVHIREILAGANDQSLILLDELGTATNAAEGAALAIEVAERLRQRRAWTLISTHHDGLKEWASAHAGDVANGSVAVDAATLAPSYQFRLGVPGVSAGLDMAARLGLPADLIAAARERVPVEARKSGEYLQRLQAALAKAEDRVAALDMRERELSQREAVIAGHDRTAMQKHLTSLRAELERRLAAFTAAAERNWQKSVAALESEITAAQKRKLAVELARQKHATAEAFATEVAAAVPGANKPAGPAGAGAQLRPGERVKLEDLKAQSKTGGRRAPVDVPTPAMLEINLIGERREAALDRLDKFLDDAVRADAAQVRIVHGAGFGVLRQAVADALQAHPSVARHFHPPQNEGGQGVTMAELK